MFATYKSQGMLKRTVKTTVLAVPAVVARPVSAVVDRRFADHFVMIEGPVGGCEDREVPD